MSKQISFIHTFHCIMDITIKFIMTCLPTVVMGGGLVVWGQGGGHTIRCFPHKASYASYTILY